MGELTVCGGGGGRGEGLGGLCLFERESARECKHSAVCMHLVARSRAFTQWQTNGIRGRLLELVMNQVVPGGKSKGCSKALELLALLLDHAECREHVREMGHVATFKAVCEIAHVSSASAAVQGEHARGEWQKYGGVASASLLSTCLPRHSLMRVCISF